LDKTLEWTAKRLEDWYGIVSPKLARDQRTYAASVLWALQGDAGQRALMAWSFGWPSAQQASRADWMAPLVAVLLDDPYDAVRFMAYRSLRSLGPFQDFDYDFLAAPHERANAIERLLDHWSQAAGAETTPTMGRALLLDVNGDVRRDELVRLLRGRDNQPITLVE
jgi:hypothetical protein